jgi:hypothetical protein
LWWGCSIPGDESRRSRCGFADTTVEQRRPKCAEDSAQAAVYIEWRTTRHQPRDFGGGKIILEPKPEEKAVVRLERGDGGLEGVIQLSGAQTFLGTGSWCVHELSKGTFIGDQIYQTPAHAMTVFEIAVIAANSAVLLPAMVETEPPHNYDEPRRELASAVISVRAKPMEVVPAKLAQNECIAIHHLIVIAAKWPRDVQDQSSVAMNECGPCLIPCGGLGMIE